MGFLFFLFAIPAIYCFIVWITFAAVLRSFGFRSPRLWAIAGLVGVLFVPPTILNFFADRTATAILNEEVDDFNANATFDTIALIKLQTSESQKPAACTKTCKSLLTSGQTATVLVDTLHNSREPDLNKKVAAFALRHCDIYETPLIAPTELTKPCIAELPEQTIESADLAIVRGFSRAPLMSSLSRSALYQRRNGRLEPTFVKSSLSSIRFATPMLLFISPTYSFAGVAQSHNNSARNPGYINSQDGLLAKAGFNLKPAPMPDTPDLSPATILSAVPPSTAQPRIVRAKLTKAILALGADSPSAAELTNILGHLQSGALALSPKVQGFVDSAQNPDITRAFNAGLPNALTQALKTGESKDARKILSLLPPDRGSDALRSFVAHQSLDEEPLLALAKILKTNQNNHDAIIDILSISAPTSDGDMARAMALTTLCQNQMHGVTLTQSQVQRAQGIVLSHLRSGGLPGERAQWRSVVMTAAKIGLSETALRDAMIVPPPDAADPIKLTSCMAKF